ncbi:MAG: trypsin-like peptidase domain-containing protein [Bacteroidota bacterium]
MKKYILVAIIGFSTGLAGVYVGWNLITKQFDHPIEKAYSIASTDGSNENIQNTAITPPTYTSAPSETGTDFSYASEKTTPCVVFIQTSSEFEYRTGSWLDWFFEPRTSQQIGSGSGVILSEDGYIVTNNHVIDDADVIKVTHNKKSYDATLIGLDPSTDLAVLKIEASNMPAVTIGKSDEVKVGEWVLAVGNPFNLTSTVTAGIISAKGRNINILRDKFPIESFIQTDAAINPGNSGGALVNRDGELIGINTAILSKTGSYAGYGFAIPSNIVKKVFNDIVKYGEVQKAFVGAEYVDIDSDLAEKMSLTNLNGVIVTNVQKTGAGASAGLEKGDVIRMVNGNQIISKAYLEEYIGNLYPGDQLKLVLHREGKEISKTLTLTNREGTTGVIKRNLVKSDYLAATFENVSKVERDLIGISNGVKVVDYTSNGFFAELGIPEGFIITNINNASIENPEELINILEKIRGRVIIAGIDKKGRKVYYPYYF